MTTGRISAFDRLSQRFATVYAAASLDIQAFWDAPVALDLAQQQRMAFSLAPRTGFAMEFGVFQGKSLRRLAQANPARRFHGFDSFEGLPEPWVRSPDTTYAAGHFAVPRLPAMPDNVELVRGFFDDSLPPWLAEHPGPVGFVHIDCDLYGGARTILTSLTDRLLPGAVIVFDELSDWEGQGRYPNWREGEWKAFGEWLAETGMRFRILSRGLTFQAAVRVWREPPPHGRDETLALLEAAYAAGHKAEATALLEGVWDDDEPWLPGACRSLAWRAASHPRETLRRSGLIWSRAQAKPDDDLAVDLYRVRARAAYALERLPEADRYIRVFLKKRPDVAAGVSLGASVARACRQYERAGALFRRWGVLTGLPKAAEAAADCVRLAEIRPELRAMQFSGLLVQHLIDARDFRTVLDIGSGAGEQAAALRAAGKQVTELDYGRSVYAAARPGTASGECLVGDFMTMAFDRQFDCVLASHVLEHQKNVHDFLVKVRSVLKEGGVLGLTVPPAKPEIVGGHLSLWNAGLLLYNLVLAGFDCRRAWVRAYGYNISVALEKRTIEPRDLVYDTGDVDRLAAFLPEGLGEGFDGDIKSLG